MKYKQVYLGLVANHNGTRREYARFALPVNDSEFSDNYETLDDLLNSGEIDFECLADESRLAEVVRN